MRLLHIGNEMSWRGGENQVRLLVEGLKGKGVLSHIAYPRKSRGLSRFSEIVPTLILPSASPWDPRNLLSLYSYCRHNGIQIVDAHSSGAHSMALGLKTLLTGLKLVVHRRVDNPIRRPSKYLNPKVDAFVGISKAISQILSSAGIEKDRLHTVYSAVETKKYQYLNTEDCRELFSKDCLDMAGKIWIGNASAFTEQKGYDCLLTALFLLAKVNDQFHVFLAGDGPLLPWAQEQVKRLRLQDRVSFLGFIDEVPHLLRALDILAMPSNNEGLGTLLLDAAAADCALCSTAVGGIPEIVIHGQTGLLCESSDAPSLANNLQKLIESQRLRERLISNCREHLQKNFSLTSMVEENWRIYRSLLSEQAISTSKQEKGIMEKSGNPTIYK